MGGVRWNATENNIVLETKLQDLQGFVRSKAIGYSYTRSLVGAILGLWVENKLKQLQAKIGIGVPFVRVRIVPPFGGVGGPIGSMG